MLPIVEFAPKYDIFFGLTFQENVKFQNLKYFENACELSLKCTA